METRYPVIAGYTRGLNTLAHSATVFANRALAEIRGRPEWLNQVLVFGQIPSVMVSTRDGPATVSPASMPAWSSCPHWLARPDWEANSRRKDRLQLHGRPAGLANPVFPVSNQRGAKQYPPPTCEQGNEKGIKVKAGRKPTQRRPLIFTLRTGKHGTMMVSMKNPIKPMSRHAREDEVQFEAWEPSRKIL